MMWSESWPGIIPPIAAMTMVRAAFGARAEVRGQGRVQCLTFPADHQRFWHAGDEDAEARLRSWLRRTAMPWFERRCGAEFFDASAPRLYSMYEGCYCAIAGNRADGAVYVGAWLLTSSLHPMEGVVP